MKEVALIREKTQQKIHAASLLADFPGNFPYELKCGDDTLFKILESPREIYNSQLPF